MRCTQELLKLHFCAQAHTMSSMKIWVRFSMTIQQYPRFCGVRSRSRRTIAPFNPSFQDLYKAMLQSWRWLMYRIFPTLRERILKNDTGLCDAVTSNWIAFQPTAGSVWVSLEKPQEQWLYTKSGTLPVHFNLLTAELLVNGLPLARLPSEYMRHPLYAPLFQKSTLEVVPTAEPGLRFSAKTSYQGYKLHFGMEGNHMLLVAIGDKCRSV